MYTDQHTGLLSYIFSKVYVIYAYKRTMICIHRYIRIYIHANIRMTPNIEKDHILRWQF